MATQFNDLANKALTDAQKRSSIAPRHVSPVRRTCRQQPQVAAPAGQRPPGALRGGVAKVEAERRDAFGDLKGRSSRCVSARNASRAKLPSSSTRSATRPRPAVAGANSSCATSSKPAALPSTPISRWRSASRTGRGRLRPDAIVRVPGGKSLIIDAKVSLKRLSGRVRRGRRERAPYRSHRPCRLDARHINGLSAKAYWSQFDDTPEYVVMFVPGEHFLSAALEHDAGLWDYAFDKKVLLATPPTSSPSPAPSRRCGVRKSLPAKPVRSARWARSCTTVSPRPATDSKRKVRQSASPPRSTITTLRVEL